MTALDTSKTVAVIGAGTMGAGIAQVAAAAGHPVLLFDVADGAARAAIVTIGKGLDRLVTREKISRETADAIVGRIVPANGLETLSGAALVIEAIIENLDIKQALFAELEDIVVADAILATNTSSISVTSIARDLRAPARVAGLHFFNPAPVMKLVEIVSGRMTDPAIAETLFDTATTWGKIAVHTRSTPGFIVNRVARPFYAEALRLCEEQVADPATLDALMKGGGGFPMGPFELMDLIGNDVNYAVSLSVFNAYYQDPRFRPSLLQLELVNAGHLGRKSGRGYYDYTEGAKRPLPRFEKPQAGTPPLGNYKIGTDTELEGVQIAMSDGRMASEVARELRRPVILHDFMIDGATTLGFTVSADFPDSIVSRFVASLSQEGIEAVPLPDWPGLVVLRTLAMLANEGFEAALQGVADQSDIDLAMRYGLNHPQGPIARAKEIGLVRVLSVLDSLFRLTGDPRYRASFALRMTPLYRPIAVSTKARLP
ncbi:MAG: 3-hydroxyacyl-CoA dehydrogenase [Alphaproteobacteria bacterium]|uniref:3-hydroxyacyl-CoA dehydrogenase NAD-binding domain-containing protein n=1 Tax=Hoeflea sp. TaxID=1940281 RepID=UPI0019CB776D|nr:3-hydroxyacyl-CoA dehydrogenase NAD-binding domain-containing protein [Hoeflea sp.]MBC7284084.1 3-hydroxyacyl-CoA dehydrogenase [Hoeflea sp.]MBU2486724.1 3-hydroxyacyl-CoA dehydrogenase [Alphaproteobacteria bacterium]